MPQCDPRARGSPKARKPLNRPALRGGVIQPGVHLTPGFYPAQKSNVWIALGGPGPHSATAAHRRPTPRFTGWRGTDATTRSGGPQRRSERPTRGRQREGRSVDTERPSALPFR